MKRKMTSMCFLTQKCFKEPNDALLCFYFVSLALRFSAVCDTRTCVDLSRMSWSFGLFRAFLFEQSHYVYKLKIVLYEYVCVCLVLLSVCKT